MNRLNRRQIDFVKGKQLKKEMDGWMAFLECPYTILITVQTSYFSVIIVLVTPKCSVLDATIL